MSNFKKVATVDTEVTLSRHRPFPVKRHNYTKHSDWAVDWTVRGSTYRRARDFSFPRNVQNRSGAHPTCYSGFFPRVKRPDSESSQSLACSAGAKKKWSYTLIPPICLLSVERVNFSFLCPFLYISEREKQVHLEMRKTQTRSCKPQEYIETTHFENKNMHTQCSVWSDEP